MKRRGEALKQAKDSYQPRQEWPLSDREIAAAIEGDIALYGADYAIDSLRLWTPRILALSVLSMVTESLLAAGKLDFVKALYTSNHLHNAWKVFVYVPCAQAGVTFPKDIASRGPHFVGQTQSRPSTEYKPRHS